MTSTAGAYKLSITLNGEANCVSDFGYPGKNDLDLWGAAVMKLGFDGWEYVVRERSEVGFYFCAAGQEVGDSPFSLEVTFKFQIMPKFLSTQ